MAPYDNTDGPDRFNSFDVYRTSYKKIGDYEIEVGILIPKDIDTAPGKKHPLFVKFHGGGLVSGTWDYPNWFANWLVPLVHRNSAIAVLPNYRLIPEHTGNDIQSDLASFWTWFHSGALTSYLASQGVLIELDYGRLLVGGDSAGGCLAIQSGLTRPEGEIRAVLAQYPMTNYLNRKPEELFMGKPAPGPEIIDEHIKGIIPGKVVSGATPPARQPLSYALAAYNRYNEFCGTGPHLWPISVVETAQFFPHALILHGDADTAVSIKDSRAFVHKKKEVLGEKTEIWFEERPGEDHGFDIDLTEAEAGWLKRAVEWVEGKWVN